MELPEVYSTSLSNDIQSIAAGDCIKVITGTLENMSGVIYKIKKKTVKVGVRLFGQDMFIEMPMENIRKITLME